VKTGALLFLQTNFYKQSIFFSITDCRHKSHEIVYKYSFFCNTSTRSRILAFPYRASRSYSDDTRGRIPLDERSTRRREPLPDDTQNPQLSINIIYLIYRINYFRATCFNIYCKHTCTQAHMHTQYMFTQSVTSRENLLRICI
jgi:hypothetical protein